eukprot:gene19539-biopygen13492
MTANVTCLASMETTVATWEADVIALQEVKLTAAAQSAMTKSMARRGWQALWGPPRPQCGQGVWNAAYGGVGILRWAHAVVAYGNGGRALHVFSMYGVTGANNTRHASWRQNEQLLEDALEAAAELGDVPVLILGDLNVRIENSALLQTALASGQWTDIAEEWAIASGTQPEPTYVRGEVESRIDYALARGPLVSTVRDFAVIQDSGIKSHRPLSAELDMEAYEQKVLRPAMPKAFPVDRWDKWGQQKEEQEAKEAVLKVQERVEAADKEDDTVQLYEAFCDAAEGYLARRSEGLLTGPERGYRGRGKEKQPKEQWLRAAQTRDVDGALGLEQRRLLRLRSQISDLANKTAKQEKLQGAGQLPWPRCVRDELREQWARIARAGAQKLPNWRWQAFWRRVHPPPAEE